MLILDSGGLTRLSERSREAAALIGALKAEGLWPPLVATPVLIESLQGNPSKEALANRFLKTCDVVDEITESLARRAAHLRSRARTESAVDALVVALAEPGGSILTSDADDLRALADNARNVVVERV